MEEGNTNESVPDLKDLETKIGRKTPEGLLKWMREDAAHRGEPKIHTPECIERDPARKSLDDKIKKLRTDMAHLRSVDVRILQQLLAVHEGIEAVKWLLDERSTLTSRCSSLTSSQYSLADGLGGPEAGGLSSWRGSWGSLHDPHDRLDNISIGSYLDTLADDMDEYGCASTSESTAVVLCSAASGADTPQGPTQTSATPSSPSTTTMRTSAGTVGVGVNSSSGRGSPVVKQPEATKEDVWTRGTDTTGTAGNGTGTGTGTSKDPKFTPNHTPSPHKSNGVLDKVLRPGVEGVCESARACLVEKLGHKSHSQSQSPSHSQGHSQSQSPSHSQGHNQSHSQNQSQSPAKAKTYQNGRVVELDTCKQNGRMHLEYDAHWRWVQSQDDVTFL
ncbi:leucine rich adaptor protein 1 [Engraulis encrasicolus]|uniref:leucine rich adaptor protein 1 n=1 Tax=Engraulis encrasicolus TaxID=184585 RepID=UPI002FD58DA5